MKKHFDPVSGKIFPVFLYYAIPSIFGVLAMSCAWVIDGFFIGHYAGVTTLAAVSLTFPMASLVVGLGLMLSVGGAVRCGRSLGRGDLPSANASFTQTLLLLVVISLASTALGLVFLDPLVLLLGATGALIPITAEYLTITLFFNVFLMGMVALSYFLRADHHPILAALSLALYGLFNVVLDWLFVVEFRLGHQGAALASGLSAMAAFFLLCIPFWTDRTPLALAWRRKDLREGFKAAHAGLSEFSTEISGAALVLVMNWFLMQKMGETGVAAFAVINYIIFSGILVSCGIGDSLQPVVSKNYGARKQNRITAFLAMATASACVLGLLPSALLLWSPVAPISWFLESGDRETMEISLKFAAHIWPVFILGGINIILTSYLTAVHKALSSTMVSLARNLFLPLFFLFLIAAWTSHDHIFIAFPLAELITLFIALYLLNKNSPAKLTRHWRPA